MMNHSVGLLKGTPTLYHYFQMQLDWTSTNLFIDGSTGVPNECFEHADSALCTECRSACVGDEPLHRIHSIPFWRLSGS